MSLIIDGVRSSIVFNVSTYGKSCLIYACQIGIGDEDLCVLRIKIFVSQIFSLVGIFVRGYSNKELPG